MLRFWFTASKFFLKIINPSCIVSHIGKIFPPEMVWHWHGFLVHQSWMLSEISSTLCPTFLDCFFSTTFSFLFLIQCAVHYIFHYLDFLRDFCSLSESMGWVDYMRIALVVFQNIERATYALETQFKLNTKCQVPNTNWQKSSIFWGGVESTQRSYRLLLTTW